ncbi:MAG: divergent polysaccharide deacetylase family protein [Geminicoccaceae bacterium]|nr:divergent polysaccharide deacetylase family protein [Geminicoccaceae bacterium]
MTTTLKRRGTLVGLLAAIAVAVPLISMQLVDHAAPAFVSTARVDAKIPAPAGEREARRSATGTTPSSSGSPRGEPDLLEPSPFGSLPQIGPSGRRPFFAYASDFDLDDSRPKVAILVLGLGLSREVTETALALPPSVGLQFSPYAPDLDQDVAAARERGHEVMLGLPMEPVDYPASDPGPHTLMVDAGRAENLDRLHWILSRTTSYVGLAGDGGRFAASEAARPIVADLAQRGLALIEVGTAALTEEARAAGLPYARTAAPIDVDPSPLSIDYALAGLEAEALENGSALGVLSAFPVSLARLARWAESLESKGLVLAPVSALLIEGAGLAARLRGDGGDGIPDHG